MTESKKRAPSWKEGKLISIRLKNNVYVLAQMVKEPYLVCFNLFTKDNDWQGVLLSENKVLFCHAVTRQFIRSSDITLVKELKPLKDYKLPRKWIYGGLGSRKRILFLNGKEREVLIPVGYYSLVERDLEVYEKNRIHGLFQKVLIENISQEHWDEIENIEDMTIATYPNLNERLYLCYLAGKNINPTLDIDLGKEIPESYETFVDIITGAVPLKDLGY